MSRALVFLLCFMAAGPLFAGEGFDCNHSDLLDAAHLGCVACAVEESTGHYPSEKFLMLLGYTTQQYVNNANFSKGADPDLAKKVFYRHIAEEIQAYGVCFENGIDDHGIVNPAIPGYGTLNARDFDPRVSYYLPGFVTGSDPVAKHSFGTSVLATNFGYNNQFEMEKMFHIPDWSYMPLPARREYFRRSINGYETNGSRQGIMLHNCLYQINQLENNAPAFQIGTRANVRLCQNIAASCNDPDADAPADTDFCIRPSLPRGGGSRSLYASPPDEGVDDAGPALPGEPIDGQQ